MNKQDKRMWMKHEDGRRAGMYALWGATQISISTPVKSLTVCNDDADDDDVKSCKLVLQLRSTAKLQWH
jgi:hypothetical protein